MRKHITYIEAYIQSNADLLLEEKQWKQSLHEQQCLVAEATRRRRQTMRHNEARNRIKEERNKEDQIFKQQLQKRGMKPCSHSVPDIRKHFALKKKPCVASSR